MGAGSWTVRRLDNSFPFRANMGTGDWAVRLDNSFPFRANMGTADWTVMRLDHSFPFRGKVGMGVVSGCPVRSF
jgi:hypothetical protein